MERQCWDYWHHDVFDLYRIAGEDIVVPSLHFLNLKFFFLVITNRIIYPSFKLSWCWNQYRNYINFANRRWIFLYDFNFLTQRFYTVNYKELSICPCSVAFENVKQLLYNIIYPISDDNLFVADTRTPCALWFRLFSSLEISCNLFRNI